MADKISKSTGKRAAQRELSAAPAKPAKPAPRGDQTIASGARMDRSGSTRRELAAPEDNAAGSRVDGAGYLHAADAVDGSQRARWIAEAAYFRAEMRGFEGGDPLQDWLDAEAEFNRWRSHDA